MRSGEGNFVSWRQLTGDQEGAAFTVYRDGEKLATVTGVTNYLDEGAKKDAVYTVGTGDPVPPVSR